MKNFQWTQKKITEGSIFPVAREGCTLTYVNDLNAIILFGGISNIRMNEVHIYDLKTNMWSFMKCSGKTPSVRCYHSTWYS